MNLNTAQLGDTRGISLGGYIPAAQQRPGLLDQALASLATSVVGAVAQKGVEGLMTPDMGKQAVANNVQMAGVEVNPQTGQMEDKFNALQRWFTPRDAKTFQQALGQQQTAQYQDAVLRQGAEGMAQSADDRALDRTFTQSRFAQSQEAEAAARQVAQEQALKDYGLREQEVKSNIDYRMGNLGLAKDQFGLAKQEASWKDPMAPYNVDARIGQQNLTGAQVNNLNANVRESDAKIKALQDQNYMMQGPAREAAISQVLEKMMPGNTAALEAVKANIRPFDVTNPEDTQAAIVEAVAKARAGAGFTNTPSAAPVVDNRSGWERTKQFGVDVGRAAGGVVDTLGDVAGGVIMGPYNFFDPEGAAVSIDRINSAKPQPNNLFSPEEIARRQEALRAQGLMK